MRFGISLPLVHQMPGQPEWETGDDIETLVAVAKRADELGYAWAPCSDHVVVPSRAAPSMGATWYDPATTLAFIAGFTQRLRLLTHVLILPYHSPLAIAKQYATLDRLSGGRVILGVGAGHLKPEFRALGADFDERGAVTDEYIRAIKALWSDEEASFDGPHVRFRDVRLSPRPAQSPHPPVWVGGNSRRAVRRAVELGDGWVPFEVTLAKVRDRMAYARSRSGFEQRSTPFEVVVPASFELTTRPIDGERAVFSGSREQVIEDIEAYRAAGVTGMTAGFRSRSLSGQLEQMTRFAETVMPEFRSG
ncbi:MAG: LLM class F420-dependent oxidoreductase [Dehalococcoidia bacterium]